MNRQTSTHDEFLKKQFSAHKLILSPVGILKICSIILFLVGPITSLAGEVCSQYGTWLQLTSPIVTVTGGVILAALYVSSVLGLAKRFPNVWVKVDITCCIIIAIVTLVLSILVISNCTSGGGLYLVPSILGILGSVLLFVSAAVLFVTWLHIDEEEESNVPSARVSVDLKRKSYMI